MPTTKTRLLQVLESWDNLIGKKTFKSTFLLIFITIYRIQKGIKLIKQKCILMWNFAPFIAAQSAATRCGRNDKVWVNRLEYIFCSNTYSKLQKKLMFTGISITETTGTEWWYLLEQSYIYCNNKNSGWNYYCLSLVVANNCY